MLAPLILPVARRAWRGAARAPMARGMVAATPTYRSCWRMPARWRRCTPLAGGTQARRRGPALRLARNWSSVLAGERRWPCKRAPVFCCCMAKGSGSQAGRHGQGGAIAAFMAEAPVQGRRPVFAGDDTTDRRLCLVSTNWGAGRERGQRPRAASLRLAIPDVLSHPYCWPVRIPVKE